MEENRNKVSFNDKITATLAIGWSLYVMIFLLYAIYMATDKTSVINLGIAFVFGTVSGVTSVYVSINMNNKKSNGTIIDTVLEDKKAIEIKNDSNNPI